MYSLWRKKGPSLAMNEERRRSLFSIHVHCRAHIGDNYHSLSLYLSLAFLVHLHASNYYLDVAPFCLGTYINVFALFFFLCGFFFFFFLSLVPRRVYKLLLQLFALANTFSYKEEREGQGVMNMKMYLRLFSKIVNSANWYNEKKSNYKKCTRRRRMKKPKEKKNYRFLLTIYLHYIETRSPYQFERCKRKKKLLASRGVRFFHFRCRAVLTAKRRYAESLTTTTRREFLAFKARALR